MRRILSQKFQEASDETFLQRIKKRQQIFATMRILKKNFLETQIMHISRLSKKNLVSFHFVKVSVLAFLCFF